MFLTTTGNGCPERSILQIESEGSSDENYFCEQTNHLASILLIVPAAQSKTVEYKRGQVWKTIFGPTVVIILKVEELPKIGKIIHVWTDKLPNVGCESLEFTRSIQHLAFTEKMLNGGLIKPIKENADLPDSYFDDHKEWEKKEIHGLSEAPIQQVILSASLPGPAICNFLPQKT